MNFKNILISAVVILTIIAGLTISIKNFAKTAFNPLCQNKNNLVFCFNNYDNFSNLRPEVNHKNSSPIEQTLTNSLPTISLNPLIIENKKIAEIPKKIEPKLETTSTIVENKIEIAKTNKIETKPIETIFAPSKSSKNITNTFYPTSQEYWNVFQGFDFSGRLKQIYNSENDEFVDNSIILRAKRELTENPLFSTTIDDERFYTKTADYAGSRIMLKERFHYGHISFQAKIPNISGILPAVWLLNQDANNFTEVDLLEVPGSEKNNVYGVTHYGPNYASLSSDHKKMNIPTLSTQFHQYDMYKTPEKISVFIDGTLLYEKNVSNAPKYNGINGLDQPLQLIINLNIGDSWAGPINDAQLPVSMIIKDMMIEEYSY
jgi:Glycosyl hydrolases family 16